MIMENVSISASVSKTATTLLSPSRKPRLPWNLLVMQRMFPVLEAIAPRYARSFFTKRFFTPWKFAIPEAEQNVLQRAETYTVQAGHLSVQVYTWGRGPAIVLVHGWAGRAGQFRSFIEYFTANGYQVIAFDAPAHGNSPGKRTNIVEFKDAIHALHAHVKKIEAIIAHSIGGAATVFALAEGLPVNTLVTIATPADAEEILHEYAVRLHASAKAIGHLRNYIYRTFNRPFHELTAAYFATRLNPATRWLILHDEHDKEISIRNATLLSNAYPHATLKITAGLGHVRILRDEATLQTCMEFIAVTR